MFTYLLTEQVRFWECLAEGKLVAQFNAGHRPGARPASRPSAPTENTTITWSPAKPRYLGPLTSTVDVPGRRALRSAGTDRLVVPPVRLTTVGSRAFPVAAAHTWNSLPEHTVSASTSQSFKRHLKTFLLQQSFRLALSGPRSDLDYLGHYKN